MDQRCLEDGDGTVEDFVGNKWRRNRRRRERRRLFLRLRRVDKIEFRKRKEGVEGTVRDFLLSRVEDRK